jgi:pimeloyl-ACP methyl ester carboxylesterase
VELAILRPALVERLELVAAVGVRVPEHPMAELFIDNFDKMRKLLFYDPHSPVVELAMPTSLEDPRMLNWLRAREATARVGWNPYLHNPKLPGHLHRVTCPTKIIWGRHDQLIPLAHGQFYHEQIAHSELVVFEQCGHMVPFEQCERFVDETVRFVG